MTHSATVAAAIVASVLSAGAASAKSHYSAAPVVVPAKASLIAGSTMWKCVAGVCTAAKATSRDTIVCEQVVRRVGSLSMFSANGATFDEAALAKCNARAK